MKIFVLFLFFDVLLPFSSWLTTNICVEPVEKMYEMMIRASSVKEDVICGITFLTTFFHMRLAFQFSGFLVLFFLFYQY